MNEQVKQREAQKKEAQLKYMKFILECLRDCTLPEETREVAVLGYN